MSFLIGMVWSASSAHAACDQASTHEDLAVTLRAATDAYGDLDRPAFESHIRTAKQQVVCLETIIDGTTAAELHRITALGAFLARDQDLAERRFGAARKIEPNFELPETLVPAGNPVRGLYKAWELGSSPIEVLERPVSGSIRLDGAASREWATALPVVFQRLDDGGVVVESELLSPGSRPPEYDGRADLTPEAKKKRMTVPLLIAAGVLGAGAVALNVASHRSKKGYEEFVIGGGAGQVFIDQANKKRNTTHALTLSSAGVGALAVGTGVAAVVTGVF